MLKGYLFCLYIYVIKWLDMMIGFIPLDETEITNKISLIGSNLENYQNELQVKHSIRFCKCQKCKDVQM